MSERREERNTREDVNLLLGILMGALLGFFGNFVETWYYNTYQKCSWFEPVIGLFGIVFFGFIAFFIFWINRWQRRLRHP